MSPVIAAPPGTDADKEPAVAAGGADAGQVIWALFAAARRRRRRIRLVRGLVVAAVVLMTAAGLAWPRHQPGAGGHRGPAAGPGAAPAVRAPLLAWADDSGQLVIGNLVSFTARAVAEADVAPSAPLVSSGGRIFWVSERGGYVDGGFWPQVVEELDPATGRSTDIGPGEYAFPSADGQRLYIAQTDNTLAEFPAAAPGLAAPRDLPAGWYLPGGSGVAVAGGVVVQSADDLALTHPADLAVWNPQTGRLTPVGRAVGVVGAYTPPGAGYSLLAWMPAGCQIPACPVTITNTATLSSRTVRSPLRHGFVLGGAFSPDGRQLAVFANDGPQAGGQHAELAVISTATGIVRLDLAVRMTVGEDADWIRWLPGGTRLVVLADRDYLVTAATLAARPFHFAGPGRDVNYSAALVVPRS